MFLGIGAAAGVFAASTAAPQVLGQHHHPLPAAALSAQGGEGGEGGEGGAAGHAAAGSDLDVLVVLAQMQGHLLVAQELLEQRQFNAAEPHVGHPVDELYGAIAPVLQARGVPPFLASLEELRQQVRLNPGAPSTALKLAQAQQRIAAVAQGLAGGVVGQVPLVMGVVRQLADSAVVEYNAALAGERVVEVIEYQDACGFLRRAQALLSQALAARPPAAAAAQLTAAERTLAAMLQAFPTLTPPPRAVLSAAQLQRLQSQL